jgi:hypothetical protein
MARSLETTLGVMKHKTTLGLDWGHPLEGARGSTERVSQGGADSELERWECAGACFTTALPRLYRNSDALTTSTVCFLARSIRNMTHVVTTVYHLCQLEHEDMRESHCSSETGVS